MPFVEGKLNISVLRQFVVLFVAHRFKPFVGRVFARHFHGDVRKPAVFFGAVPVFHTDGDFHAVARFKGAGFFAPLLIPAFAGDAQQNLSAALVGVVDVPVVAAARLECHVGEKRFARRRRAQRVEIRRADKIFCVGGVLMPFAENVLLFKFFIIHIGLLICPATPAIL